MKNVSDKRNENQNTYFMFNNFVSSKIVTFIMWINMVKPDRTQNNTI